MPKKSTKKTNPHLTKKEVEELLRLKAYELAVLLHLSNMPMEIKKSWIALLPEMTLEQIDKFIMVLENALANNLTKDLDGAFLKKLKEITFKFAKEQEELDDKFLKKLNKFKENLKKVN